MRSSNTSRKITLPIVRVNGAWEFIDGGGVPLRDGARAELTFLLSDINDPEFLRRVTQERLVRIFEESTQLRVALNARAVLSPYSPMGMNVDIDRWPSGCTIAVPITVGPVSRETEKFDAVRGGLWMRQTGMDRGELICSTVLMPEDMDVPVAQSLNHAFTVLSERFETHRISHTGNVHERVFYRDSNDKWYPIGDIRDGIGDRAAREIIANAWAQLAPQLGFVSQPGTSGARDLFDDK